jgi:hypothetical protein
VLKNQIGCAPQGNGGPPRTKVHTTGRLLEVVSDCDPREMAEADCARHKRKQNPAYRSVKIKGSSETEGLWPFEVISN